MSETASPVPEGFNTVTPHLVVQDTSAAIEFYKKAFGAEEIVRIPGPDGKRIMHAEVQIGNSRVMLCDEFPEMQGCRTPVALNGTSVTIHIYVNDADAVFSQAVDAGAIAAMPTMDTFWGDRYGKVVDPFGHHWSIATHVKDLTPEEIAKGAAECFKQPPPGTES